MATQAELRQRVADYLYGTFPTEAPFVSRLAASYTSGPTSVTVLDDTQWEINDVLENIETGEQFMVVAKPGSDVLTVISGWAGTTPAASVGSDDVLYKNPRFTIKKIDDGISDAMSELSRWGIHAFGYGSITRADPQEFYELAETDIMDQYGVLKLYEVLDNSELPNALPFRYHYTLGTDPTEYSVGHGVSVLDFGQSNNGGTLYFVYAQLLNDVANLLSRQEELVVLGAAARLLGTTISPATHDPGARTDRTMQPGQTSRDVRYLQGRFISEARQESAQLTVERQHMLSESMRGTRSRRWVS